MGRAHAYAYRTAPLIRPGATTFVPVVDVGTRRGAAWARSPRGVGLEAVTDWRALVERADVDVVDICTPPGTHAEIAVAAAARGQGRRVREAARDDATPTPPRRSTRCARPACVTRSASTTGACRRSRCWPSWSPRAPSARSACGAGRGSPTSSSTRRSPSTGASSARWAARRSPTSAATWSTWRTWMLGPIAEVSRDVVDLRRRARDARRAPRRVEVDDASSALVRFASGAPGDDGGGARRAAATRATSPSRSTARRAPRCSPTPGSTNCGSGSTDDDPRLYGLRRVRAEHPRHPETAGWWPIGQGVGYDASLVNQAADLAAAWPDGEPWDPGFDQGAAVVAVCARWSDRRRAARWVAVDA